MSITVRNTHHEHNGEEYPPWGPKGGYSSLFSFPGGVLRWVFLPV